jgi:hypothetical protein
MMLAAAMMMMMIGSMVVSRAETRSGQVVAVMAFSSGARTPYPGRRGCVPSPASQQQRRRWRRRRSLALFVSPSSSRRSETSLESSSKKDTEFMRTTPSEEERPVYPKSRRVESAAVAAASASMSQRPGAIIETEEQLDAKARILKEMDEGTVTYKNSEWLQEVFGEVMVVLDEDEEEVDDDDTAKMDIMGGGGEDGDDDQLLDANTLGTWTIEDIRSKFDYEWDPNGSDPDPNLVSLNQPAVRYVEEAPMDPNNDGVELGYDPIFGPSSPIDKRTILGAKDSYMVDPATRDEKRLQPQFARNDPELHFNQEVVEFRQAMDIMETFVRSKC